MLVTAPVTITSPGGVRSAVLTASSVPEVVLVQRRRWSRGGGWDLHGGLVPERWPAVEALLEQGWTVEGDLDALRAEAA